jgi:MoaA/NifB/PqqE/SkfB family radical SAM enzyme
METGRALQLIDDLAAAGTCSVCFDGGEPLFHPGIGDMIARANERGLRVALSTNGTLIPQHLDVLGGISVLKVSLDGTEQQHDRGRGQGAFKRAIAGAKAAIDRGLQVTLRMTLAEHNTDGWKTVLAIANDLRCKALFQPAIGSVTDQSVPPGIHSAAPERYRTAIDGIRAAMLAGAPVANEVICLDHLRYWPDPRPVPFCAGGRIEAAIGPDGSIYPCGRYGRHLPAPNVFTSGLEAAFHMLARPQECANCWCTLTLATCFLWRLDPRLLRGRLRLPFGRRHPERPTGHHTRPGQP